jgi:hypothetical protein
MATIRVVRITSGVTFLVKRITSGVTFRTVRAG